MTPDILGSTAMELQETPDGDGYELQIDDDIADILDLEPGDPVSVTVTPNPDGTLTITGDLVETGELTDEQRQALRTALTDSAE